MAAFYNFLPIANIFSRALLLAQKVWKSAGPRMGPIDIKYHRLIPTLIVDT